MLDGVRVSTPRSSNDLTAEQYLPRSLLLTAGILIALTEPVWLTVNGQLSLAMLTGSKPFHFSVLTGFTCLMSCSALHSCLYSIFVGFSVDGA
jgi:hypothetical protein